MNQLKKDILVPVLLILLCSMPAFYSIAAHEYAQTLKYNEYDLILKNVKTEYADILKSVSNYIWICNYRGAGNMTVIIDYDHNLPEKGQLPMNDGYCNGYKKTPINQDWLMFS